MDLTEANKKYIDGLSYRELLRTWRFSPSGNHWIQDQTGKYWGERIKLLALTVDTVVESKEVGWRN